MDKKCIIGAFGSDTGIRQIVATLLENGLEQNDISVVLSDEGGGRQFISSHGPLLGATMENLRGKLTHIGLSIDYATEFISYLKDGGAIIAIATDEENFDDVSDLLNQYGAQYIQTSE